MANRQDSGKNPTPENERPASRNEDALPEMSDDLRGRADEADDDEFDVDVEEVDEQEEEDEGNY